MSGRPTNTFRFRVAGVLLTLAMLLSPSVAQVNAAEYCRKSCAALKAAGEANCCGNASHAAAPADPEQSNTGASETPKGYCPGCGGRPLFVTAPCQMPSLDPTPIFLPDLQFLTSASFDVPFAIFHPPRA
jgi:hypothetical protein